MLTPGAHAFLRRGGARMGRFLGTGEDVFELVHPGVGKHQRGVVMRHERRGRQRAMALAFKIIQERRSDIGNACHRGDGIAELTAFDNR